MRDSVTGTEQRLSSCRCNSDSQERHDRPLDAPDFLLREGGVSLVAEHLPRIDGADRLHADTHLLVDDVAAVLGRSHGAIREIKLSMRV